MAGEETVGGIQGFLRLDADQFHREITRALAEIKVLDGQDVKVDVKTNSQSVERDLLRVSKAAQGVGRDVDRMGGSFKGLHDPRVLVGGIAAGMALLGPVTGAATAALGGFVGVVGTGILAFKGFQSEVEKGTALGQYLQGQLDGIKGEFAALGSTAASAMQGDVLKSLSDVRRFLPTINPEVEALAGHLGAAFHTTTGGLITGLQVMMPLLQDGGRYAEVLANKFAAFTASDDFRDFIDYARRELPEVGQNLLDLVDGVTHLAVALAPVGDQLVSLIGLLGDLSKAASPVVNFFAKANKFTLAGVVNMVEDWRGANNDAVQAVDKHTSHLLTLQSIQSPLASALGTTDAALNAAREAHQKNADAAANATLQMQYENDAAGLLRQALDKLNGKALNVATTQNQFDSALANSNKHIDKTGKTIDRATTSLTGNSAAAVANRGELIQQVKAAEDVATAYRDNGKSQDETRDKMIKMRDQILANAKAHGLDTDEVRKFIDKIYQIPKKVPPTRLEIEKASAMKGIAAFQKAIDSLHGKRVEVGVHYAYTGKLPNGGRSTAGGTTFRDGGVIGAFRDGGKIPGYASGTIVGPGTGTSDSILAAIAGTQQMIRVSNGEFISTAASQRKNRAALEAGNKGATLAVAGVDEGPVELGDVTIAKLAAAMGRVQLRPVVSARQFDSAMAVSV